MVEALNRRAATVEFWDGYAEWYELWLKHTDYHSRIIDVLTTMVEPGWKVLDIGAGNGVLSLPLCARNCNVTALEPSIGMRNLLYEESFRHGIDWLKVDERRWEDIPFPYLQDQDLVIACNSLHLTEMRFENALKKVFLSKPKQVFLATEYLLSTKIEWTQEPYRLLFAKSYDTESSFFYHHMDEVTAHWSFIKGRTLSAHEVMALSSRLSQKDDHLCMEDTARVAMYWWERI